MKAKDAQKSQNVFVSHPPSLYKVSFKRQLEITSLLFALIRDQTLPAYLCANRILIEGHPSGCAPGKACLWKPDADYLPVDLFLIIIHVYKLSSLGTGHRSGCMRDEQTATAGAHRSGHAFIHGETKPST